VTGGGSACTSANGIVRAPGARMWAGPPDTAGQHVLLHFAVCAMTGADRPVGEEARMRPRRSEFGCATHRACAGVRARRGLRRQAQLIELPPVIVLPPLR